MNLQLHCNYQQQNSKLNRLIKIQPFASNLFARFTNLDSDSSRQRWRERKHPKWEGTKTEEYGKLLSVDNDHLEKVSESFVTAKN
jgi:phage gpG-like protein